MPETVINLVKPDNINQDSLNLLHQLFIENPNQAYFVGNYCITMDSVQHKIALANAVIIRVPRCSSKNKSGFRHYILSDSLIGKGSYANVYDGYKIKLDDNNPMPQLGKNIYAIKKFNFNSFKDNEKITQEADVAKKLNYMRAKSIVHTKYGSFFVMAKLKGKQILRIGSFDPLFKCVTAVLKALKEIQLADVVHHDLHEGNILFDGTRAWIIDFGCGSRISSEIDGKLGNLNACLDLVRNAIVCFLKGNHDDPNIEQYKKMSKPFLDKYYELSKEIDDRFWKKVPETNSYLEFLDQIIVEVEQSIDAGQQAHSKVIMHSK